MGVEMITRRRSRECTGLSLGFCWKGRTSSLTISRPGSSSSFFSLLADHVEQVRGIGKTFDSLGESVYDEVARLPTRVVPVERADSRASVYFDGVGRVTDTPV